jgi:hypothetical protein
MFSPENFFAECDENYSGGHHDFNRQYLLTCIEILFYSGHTQP